MPESKFNECAEAYRAYRPEYPKELYDFLEQRFRLSSDSTIVDVGAGTGKAAIAMAKRGWKVVAIELSIEMIEQGKKAAKEAGVEIDYRHGTAEDIQVKTACADLVTTAQAFHWFDVPKTLKECHRVLKPNGGVAIWWNSRDKKKAAYLQAIQDLIHKYNSDYKTDLWKKNDSKEADKHLKESQLFKRIQKRVFRHETYLTFDGYIGLANSFSYVGNAMNSETKVKFFMELRTLLKKEFPEGCCWVPYSTDLYSAFRK